MGTRGDELAGTKVKKAPPLRKPSHFRKPGLLKKTYDSTCQGKEHEAQSTESESCTSKRSLLSGDIPSWLFMAAESRVRSTAEGGAGQRDEKAPQSAFLNEMYEPLQDPEPSQVKTGLWKRSRTEPVRLPNKPIK